MAGHAGMRKDVIPAVSQSLDHRFCAFGGRQDPVDSCRASRPVGGQQAGCRAVGADVGSHRLGTQHRDPNAQVAVGNADPLSQRDGCVLGHRIVQRPDLGEQASSRRGVEKMPAPGGHHVRDGVAGCVQVRHDVHVEHASQLVVRSLQASHGDISGVGHQEVDRPMGGHRAVDQGPHGFLIGDIASHRGAADPVGHRRHAIGIPVHGHHSPGSLSREALHQSLPDSTRRSRHHHDTVSDLHGYGSYGPSVT